MSTFTDPARRVLVVDDNERLVTIITQSRMLEIIAGVLDSLPDPAHRTLREVNLHKKDVCPRSLALVRSQFLSLLLR